MKTAGKRSYGFTLVELIVVIAILVILAAILIPTVSGYINDSKAGVCATNANALLRDYTYKFTSQIASHGTKTPLQLLEQAALDNNCTKSGEKYVGLCPSNGEYTLSISDDGAPVITCSVHGEIMGTTQGASEKTFGYTDALSALAGLNKNDTSVTYKVGNEEKTDTVENFLKYWWTTKDVKNGMSIDSTSVASRNASAVRVLNSVLTADGAGYSVYDWRIYKREGNANQVSKPDQYNVFLALESVAGKNPGDKFTCIRYDMLTKQYTVGRTTVQNGNAGDGINYPVIDGYTFSQDKNSMSGGNIDVIMDQYKAAHPEYFTQD